MGECNDVHIVWDGNDYREPAMKDELEQAAAARARWEQRQEAQRLEAEDRYRREREMLDTFDRVSWEVRLKATEKLSQLIDALDPYVDGTMGDVTAGMADVYVKAVKGLAAMYAVQKPPRTPAAPPPEPEPPVVADTAAVEAKKREAVELLRAEGLRQLASVRERLLEIEAAKGEAAS